MSEQTKEQMEVFADLLYETVKNTTVGKYHLCISEELNSNVMKKIFLDVLKGKDD